MKQSRSIETILISRIVTNNRPSYSISISFTKQLQKEWQVAEGEVWNGDKLRNGNTAKVGE